MTTYELCGRSPWLTVERSVVLREARINGDLNEAVLAALTALPGPPIPSHRAVRDVSRNSLRGSADTRVSLFNPLPVPYRHVTAVERCLSVSARLIDHEKTTRAELTALPADEIIGYARRHCGTRDFSDLAVVLAAVNTKRADAGLPPFAICRKTT